MIDHNVTVYPYLDISCSTFVLEFPSWYFKTVLGGLRYLMTIFGHADWIFPPDILKLSLHCLMTIFGPWRITLPDDHIWSCGLNFPSWYFKTVITLPDDHIWTCGLNFSSWYFKKVIGGIRYLKTIFGHAGWIFPHDILKQSLAEYAYMMSWCLCFGNEVVPKGSGVELASHKVRWVIIKMADAREHTAPTDLSW